MELISFHYWTAVDGDVCFVVNSTRKMQKCGQILSKTYDIGVGKIEMLCDIVKSGTLNPMFFSLLIRKKRDCKNGLCSVVLVNCNRFLRCIVLGFYL